MGHVLPGLSLVTPDFVGLVPLAVVALGAAMVHGVAGFGFGLVALPAELSDGGVKRVDDGVGLLGIGHDDELLGAGGLFQGKK